MSAQYYCSKCVTDIGANSVGMPMRIIGWNYEHNGDLYQCPRCLHMRVERKLFLSGWEQFLYDYFDKGTPDATKTIDIGKEINLRKENYIKKDRAKKKEIGPQLLIVVPLISFIVLMYYFELW